LEATKEGRNPSVGERSWSSPGKGFPRPRCDSHQVGHYLPGTRIPIRSDEELFTRLDKTQVMLNLAWHIPNEIGSYLRDYGYKGRLVHIV
jgi:hypothetical protein